MKIKWSVSGKSLIGPQHIRNGLTNQDAIAWKEASTNKNFVILALADGHGSPKHFRSEDGSRFAVDAALDVLDEVGSFKINGTNISAFRSMINQSVLKKIVHSWISKVQMHFNENPLSDTEKDILSKKLGAKTAAEIGENLNVKHAYGTTLMSILLTQDFCIFAQIGDGDILVVGEDGKVLKPLPDDDLLGTETKSLSTEESWNDFRTNLFSLDSSNMPSLILASTDGYSRSFKDDESFIKIGNEYLTLIKSIGFENVNEKLGEFLTETTENGSGDDITLGMIYASGNIAQRKSEYESNKESD